MRTILFGILMVAATMPCMAADTLPPDQRAQLEAAINTPYPGAGATVQDVNGIIAGRVSACRQLRPYLKRLKTETNFMHCVFDGYLDSWRAIGAQDLDLANELVTGEYAIAERLDQHKITATEKDAEVASLLGHLQTETQRRASAAQQALAAQQAVEAQQRSAQAQEVELERQRQQAQAEAQARRSRALACFGAGLLQNAPTFGSALGNAYQAQAYCAAGLPPPLPAPPPQPTTTTCLPVGTGFQCTQQ